MTITLSLVRDKKSDSDYYNNKKNTDSYLLPCFRKKINLNTGAYLRYLRHDFCYKFLLVQFVSIFGGLAFAS